MSKVSQGACSPDYDYENLTLTRKKTSDMFNQIFKVKNSDLQYVDEQRCDECGICTFQQSTSRRGSLTSNDETV